MTQAIGWANAHQGRAIEGLDQLHRGLAAYQALGAESRRSYYLGLMADVYWQLGQHEDGLHRLTEALTFVHQTHEQFYEAELHCLRGRLLLSQSTDNDRQAEASFQRAIAIAQRQNARLHELRAAFHLAKQWQRQDKRQDAYDLLAPVYGWFTEGFDTPDLRDAKRLLDELVEGQ